MESMDATALRVVLLAVIMFAIAAVDAFMVSKYKKLNPPGKFNPSFKKNFKSALIRYAVLFGFFVLLVSL